MAEAKIDVVLCVFYDISCEGHFSDMTCMDTVEKIYIRLMEFEFVDF